VKAIVWHAKSFQDSPGLNDLATLYAGLIHEIYLLDIHLLLAITIVVSNVVLLKQKRE
jgi:hypothetical protein